MAKWYFTFGSNHKYPNSYHVIEAETSADAREEMFRDFGDKWAMQYDSAEEAGVERWNLTEI